MSHLIAAPQTASTQLSLELQNPPIEEERLNKLVKMTTLTRKQKVHRILYGKMCSVISKINTDYYPVLLPASNAYQHQSTDRRLLESSCFLDTNLL